MESQWYIEVLVILWILYLMSESDEFLFPHTTFIWLIWTWAQITHRLQRQIVNQHGLFHPHVTNLEEVKIPTLLCFSLVAETLLLEWGLKALIVEFYDWNHSRAQNRTEPSRFPSTGKVSSTLQLLICYDIVDLEDLTTSLCLRITLLNANFILFSHWAINIEGGLILWPNSSAADWLVYFLFSGIFIAILSCACPGVCSKWKLGRTHQQI